MNCPYMGMGGEVWIIISKICQHLTGIIIGNSVAKTTLLNLRVLTEAYLCRTMNVSVSPQLVSPQYFIT